MMPVKLPLPTNVSPVANYVPLVGSRPSAGSMPLTVKVLTPSGSVKRKLKTLPPRTRSVCRPLSQVIV